MHLFFSVVLLSHASVSQTFQAMGSLTIFLSHASGSQAFRATLRSHYFQATL